MAVVLVLFLEILFSLSILYKGCFWEGQPETGHVKRKDRPRTDDLSPVVKLVS